MPPLMGILLGAFFVAMNAFFVLAEFSIVKVRTSRIQELLRSGNLLAPILANRILPQLDTYLSVTQIGITIASLALGWIGEPAVASVLHEGLSWFGKEGWVIPEGVSFGIGFLLVTAAHVIVGELIPKTIAIQKAETMALWCARPLQFFFGFFYPILWVFNIVANWLLAPFGMQSRPEEEIAHTPQELRILLSSTKERGLIDPQVYSIIDNAFTFRARTVREVMVPRERVSILTLNRSYKESRDAVRRARHTRYPLCETSIDDPIGLVHLKDIMLRTFSSTKEVDLRRFRRDVFEVTPDMRLDRALAFLRSRSAHLAIVRFPGKPADGIVCLEDIVEQIVGTLEDEFDREERISISELIQPGLVQLGLEAPNKAALLRRGVELIKTVKEDLDADLVFKALEQREVIFSTGIGGGVAIPHAILEDITKPRLAVIRLRRPVDYGAIDFQPVKLVFLFLLPASNAGLRLRLFSEVASLLQSPGTLERLLATPSAEQLCELIRQKTAKTVGAR